MDAVAPFRSKESLSYQGTTFERTMALLDSSEDVPNMVIIQEVVLALALQAQLMLLLSAKNGKNRSKHQSSHLIYGIDMFHLLKHDNHYAHLVSWPSYLVCGRAGEYHL